MSWPNWQTQIASGRRRVDPLDHAVVVDVSAWCSSIPRSRAASATGGGATLRPRPRGRSGGVTTSAGRCGDAASAREHVDREGRGAEDRPFARQRRVSLRARPRSPPRRLPRRLDARATAARAYRRPRAGCEAPPCAAPCSVRSMISTPSRWSISCWITRASRPDASIRISSPCSSCAPHADVDGPLDVDGHAGQAQTALLCGLRSSEVHSSAGLTTATSGASEPTR